MDIRSRIEALLWRRLRHEAKLCQIDQAAAPLIFHQGEVMRVRQFCQFAQVWRGGEADDTEVAGVDGEDHPRRGRDGVGIVAQMGPVRRADLDQRRPTLA